MMQDIIVFGCGAYYFSKEAAIRRQYNIIVHLDNKAPRENVYCNNGSLVNPKYVLDFPDIPIFIMAGRDYFVDMVKQLLLLGVNPNRIVLGMMIRPYFDTAEEMIAQYHGIFKITEKAIIFNCDLREYKFYSKDEYLDIIRQLSCKSNKYIQMIKQLPTRPISSCFGLDRGDAIDRYYIDSFIEQHQDVICGGVMEIGDDRYIKKYGHDIEKAYTLHVSGWGLGDHPITGNLATGEGLEENFVDCLICTQTIQMIYDLSSVISNIYKILKKGGSVILSVHGIAQISMTDYKNWGEYWRMTKQALVGLLSEQFPTDNIEVSSYGNVKTACGLLYGLSQEDMPSEDFNYQDEQYPVVIMAICKKI